MNVKEAIETLKNTSNFCRDMGARGQAFDLLEVIKVVEELEEDLDAKYREEAGPSV